MAQPKTRLLPSQLWKDLMKTIYTTSHQNWQHERICDEINQCFLSNVFNSTSWVCWLSWMFYKMPKILNIFRIKYITSNCAECLLVFFICYRFFICLTYSTSENVCQTMGEIKLSSDHASYLSFFVKTSVIDGQGGWNDECMGKNDCSHI